MDRIAALFFEYRLILIEYYLYKANIFLGGGHNTHLSKTEVYGNMQQEDKA